MPYIQMDIAKEISQKQKEAIKAEAGRLISLLPGKSENVLMVSIHDGVDMYFRGKAENCAFIEVRLFHESPADAKADFAREFCKAVGETVDIEISNIFMNYIEFSNWVSGGVFK